MGRKENDKQQKQRCKECGRRIGVEADGTLVQHKCGLRKCDVRKVEKIASKHQKMCRTL